VIDVNTARQRLQSFLDLNHRGVQVGDLDITDTPGYWKVRSGCSGGQHCRHAFRGELGPCDGTTELTIYFAEHGRDSKGRFLRPYRVWRMLRG